MHYPPCWAGLAQVSTVRMLLLQLVCIPDWLLIQTLLHCISDVVIKIFRLVVCQNWWTGCLTAHKLTQAQYAGALFCRRITRLQYICIAGLTSTICWCIVFAGGSHASSISALPAAVPVSATRLGSTVLDFTRKLNMNEFDTAKFWYCN